MKAASAILVLITLLTVATARANTPPVVSNVVATQRPHTALVDVTYDVADADADLVYVTLWYSLDNGASWDHQCVTVSGDVGPDIAPGTGHAMTWDAGTDVPDFINAQFKLRVYADDGGAAAIWTANFEGGCPSGWTLNGDWQCGAPTSGPGAASDGTNCLATVLNGDYNDNQSWAGSTADSPVIDLVAASAPQLSFQVWIDTEPAYDGFNLQISTNSGSSFAPVMAVSPAYNYLSLGGQPAWGGNQSALGWQEFTADLSEYVGYQVILRLAFHSDASGTYPGVYADAFVVSD